MIVAAIATVVAAAAGLVGGLVNKGVVKNATIDAGNQSRVDYQRQKTLGVYDLVKNEKQTLLIIIALGMGLLFFIYSMNTKK